MIPQLQTIDDSQEQEPGFEEGKIVKKLCWKKTVSIAFGLEITTQLMSK